MSDRGTVVSKIVFVNRFFYPDHSATAQLVSDLAFELAENEKSVVVLASRQRYCNLASHKNETLAARETVRGVEIHRLWSSRFGRALPLGRLFDYLTFYVSAFFALWRHVDRGDVVVAKTDPPLISVAAWFIVRLKGAVLVNWLQDIFPDVAIKLGVRALTPVAPLLSRLARLSWCGAVANVVIGEAMARRIRGEVGDRSRVEVVYNWCDEDIEPVPAENNHLKRAWNIDKQPFIVGYSGNLGQCHDIETIVQAVLVLRDVANIKFLFIGEGAKRQQIEKLIEDYQLDNVMLQGYQPRSQLAESLSVADVHLVSQLPCVEGLMSPSKLYGVLAAGRPVLHVGRCDGEVGQWVRTHQLGESVASGDAHGLARAILRMANHQDLAAVGARARTLYEHRFHRSVAMRRWITLLEQIQQSASPRENQPVLGDFLTVRDSQ